MEKKIAHLGFIQAIISRMGSNSFLLKGWSVTLVAAIFALAPKDADKHFLLIAYVPILMFWLLDAFYFHQEKLFIYLYNEVAADRIPSDNFSLDTSSVLGNILPFYSYLYSKTILPFHGGLVGIVFFAILYVAAR